MTRRTLVAVLALTSAGMLSGCAGAQPGVAAQVGDETIRVSDVNRLSDGYCAAYERQLEGDGTVLPMEVVTSNVVQTLTMTAVARQLAEEHGVEPSTTYEQNLANLEQAGDALADDAGEAKVTIESGLAYVNDILEQIGRKTLAEDGVTDPTVVRHSDGGWWMFYTQRRALHAPFRYQRWRDIADGRRVEPVQQDDEETQGECQPLVR